MRSWLGAVVCLLLACATPPDTPPPGTSRVWGHVQLVPREGVPQASAGGGAYGDRRLRDVELVDYSRPGFAVVYVVDEVPPDGELAFAIRETRVGPRIEPARGAVGARGRLVVANRSDAERVVSYPAAGVVRRLAPGERVEMEVPFAGEQGLFLLDVPAAAATLFASPGAFSTVSALGRFELTGLAPGPRELRVWHPRFPPGAQAVDLAPDASLEVEFSLGVGRDGHEHAH